jgi:hypothetical protein
MFRAGIACRALLLGFTRAALAEPLTERGGYLAKTIMACLRQLPHAERRDGKSIAEKPLSGGLTITSPAFTATAPNITPRSRKRNWKPERSKDQARLGGRNAAGSRPSRWRAAGGGDAGRLLHGTCAGRSRRHHRRLPAYRCRDQTGHHAGYSRDGRKLKLPMAYGYITPH